MAAAPSRFRSLLDPRLIPGAGQPGSIRAAARATGGVGGGGAGGTSPPPAASNHRPGCPLHHHARALPSPPFPGLAGGSWLQSCGGGGSGRCIRDGPGAFPQRGGAAAGGRGMCTWSSAVSLPPTPSPQDSLQRLKGASFLPGWVQKCPQYYPSSPSHVCHLRPRLQWGCTSMGGF